jgi:hemolysin III
MSDAAPPLTKPLLRGVSHEIAAGVALAGCISLTLSAQNVRARTGALVYGLTLVALFSISALYHRPTWAPRARAWMRRLDHSAIFLLIAGTYTPICLLLGGTKGNALLAVVWIGAVAGVVFSVAWLKAPKWLLAACAVVLGWVILPVASAVHAAVGTWGLVLIGLGGVAYTLGALTYALKRPNPFPRVFGYHEVFHALVILAAALHFAVVARLLPAIAA